jgi:intracellular multiplication protein IcmS
MKQDISNMLVKIAKEMNAKFYLLEKPVTPEEVFATSGLLPAFARRADQLCSLCMGYGLGISFRDAEQGILGVEVIFDEATPASLRLIFITDIMVEFMNASPGTDFTPLDELLKDSMFD